MEDALAALAREELHNPLRFVVRPPGATTLMGLMPAYRSAPAPAYSLKTVCIAPGNRERGLDSHQGFVAVFDGETGQVLGLVNAGAITAIRTAAVTAVATRLLARPGSTHARDPRRRDAGHVAPRGDARRAPARAGARLEPHARAAWPRSATASRRSRLPRRRFAAPTCVVTATAAREPIVRREWLADGAHVNAVGSSIPTTRELDTATMAAAALYVDRRESTVNESGDYLFAARDGAIGPDHIRGEIGELLIGAAEGRRSDSELTVFKSLGLAVEDLAAAELVLRRAEAEGAGVEVDL